MRTGLILARPHGKKEFIVISGPEIPVSQQDAEFKEFISAGSTHKEIAEVQKWTSDSGLFRTLRFDDPKTAAAKAKQNKADIKAHQEWLESQKNPEKKADKAEPAAVESK